MNRKEALRWVAILGAGAIGLTALADGVKVIYHEIREGSPEGALFLLQFILVPAGVPLPVSYFAFKRRYRSIVVVAATVGSLVIWGELMSLPRQLGVDLYFDQRVAEGMRWAFLALAVYSLFIFGPIYAAVWFFRFSLRFADRHWLRDSVHEPKD